MKLDDPKLTAFALSELPQHEREEMETHLRNRADAAAEIAETREMAGILQNVLHAEQGAPLLEHQRDAVLRAAAIAGGRPAMANERDLVAPHSWWQRVGVWQGIAACAVVSFATYALSVNLAKPPASSVARGGSELSVGVPGDNAVVANANAGPEVGTPADSQRNSVATGNTKFDVAKTLPNGAPVPSPSVNPSIAADVPKNSVGTPDAPVPFEPRGIAKNNASAIKKPSIIGTQNPERAGADIGKVAATDQSVRAYLQDRLREAGTLREGSTYAELGAMFRPAKDAQPGATQRFEMIRCPSIKVDVELVGADGQPAAMPPATDAKIKKLSKPYLDAQ